MGNELVVQKKGGGLPALTTEWLLPDAKVVEKKLKAIMVFQNICHKLMVDGHDYGVIPNTSKPTLLKPGAEKIAKLLELADSYEILDRQENWEEGSFFRYIIRCTLTHIGTGLVVSQGLGECNSMESKYRFRWVWSSDAKQIGIDTDIKTTKNVWRRINTKNGVVFQFRVLNDDIFSQVNTLLKMAKKRALVDASLSAGRLSDIFTQDIEDIKPVETPEGETVEETGILVTCPIHNEPWTEGQYGKYHRQGKENCSLLRVLNAKWEEVDKKKQAEFLGEKKWKELSVEEKVALIDKVNGNKPPQDGSRNDYASLCYEALNKAFAEEKIDLERLMGWKAKIEDAKADEELKKLLEEIKKL